MNILNKLKTNKTKMISKAFIIISLLLSNRIYSNSISIENNSLFESLVDCDSMFIEAEDKFLFRFIIRHQLEYDYDRRNDNYEACYKFLSEFFSLIDNYREEEGKQNHIFKYKRIYKMNPN
jgi:hypothetical protein